MNEWLTSKSNQCSMPAMNSPSGHPRRSVSPPLAGHYLAKPLSGISRRRFLHHAAVAGAASFAILPGQAEELGIGNVQRDVVRKVKLGVIGNGGRGAWIAGLFKKHAGYELWAVTDYFQEVADACGDSVGVDKSRRFSGLSGYKRLIESGVEAVALETPPCFFPEHARAAVEAGLHVYMAKPVAVDVPGCLEIENHARVAGAKKLCFMVDYQIPTDPHNQEVVRRVRQGEIGPIATLNSHYFAGPFPDPTFTDTLESRLQSLIWCNDVPVGGGYHVNACIHAVDSALWVAGQRPVAAMGVSHRLRKNPHGDSHDVFQIIFEFPDGLTAAHRGEHLDNFSGFDVMCEVQGQSGVARICYGGKASSRGAEEACEGSVENLYEAGAVRNIATFHDDILAARYSNSTVRRSVDGALATILGREAALRKTRVTLDQLLKENRRIDIDLRGLKT